MPAGARWSPGAAIHSAATEVRKKILDMASEQLEVDIEDLELGDGEVRVKGVPESSIKLGQLAMQANPLRGAVKPGVEPGLEGPPPTLAPKVAPPPAESTP